MDRAISVHSRNRKLTIRHFPTALPLTPSSSWVGHLFQEQFDAKLPHVPCSWDSSGQGFMQEHLISDFWDIVFLPDEKHNSEERTVSLSLVLGAVVPFWLLAAIMWPRWNSGKKGGDPDLTEQLNSILDPPACGFVILWEKQIPVVQAHSQQEAPTRASGKQSSVLSSGHHIHMVLVKSRSSYEPSGSLLCKWGDGTVCSLRFLPVLQRRHL